jgi:hypothetical protein
VTEAGAFVAVSPQRVLDTRVGLGARKGIVTGGHDVALKVLGSESVGDSAGTVVLTVTATGSTGAGTVVVYPDGTAEPSTSNLNYSKGQTIANEVTALIGSDGKVDLHVAGGSTQLVVDVVGYYLRGVPSSPGTTTGIYPERLLDTRRGLGGTELGAGKTLKWTVGGQGPVPDSGVSATVANLTVTDGTRAGYLTVYPAGAPRPATSNLNFGAGQTIADTVVTSLGAGGVVDITNSSAGPVQLVGDIQAYVYSTSQARVADALPLPVDGSASGSATQVLGASCPAVETCVVVGQYGTTSGTVRPLIEMQSSGVWTAMAGPLPASSPSSNADLLDVACPTVNACFAVGTEQRGLGITSGFIDTLDDGVWTATAAPHQPGAQPGEQSLNHVACPSTTMCAAVGHYDPAAGQPEIFNVVLADGTWTATTSAVPSTGTSSAITGLSVAALTCPAVGDCIAVGYFGVRSATTGAITDSYGLIDTLAAGEWTATTAPQPSDAGTTDSGASLDTVSCPTTSTCLAGGEYTNTTSVGKLAPLLETLTSDAWTPSQPPLPADAFRVGPSGIQSLSCQSATACVGIGEYTAYDHHPGTSNAANFQDTLSGTSWTSTRINEPPNAIDNETELDVPAEVSCQTDGQCAVAGEYIVPVLRLYLQTSGPGQRTTVAEEPVPADSQVPNYGNRDTLACSPTAYCIVAADYNSDSGGYSIYVTQPSQ